MDGGPLRGRLTGDVVKADHARITAVQFRQLVEALHTEGRLSYPQRCAVLLRCEDPPVTWENIARIQRCSVRTSRTHYTRAVQAIMRAMEVT